MPDVPEVLPELDHDRQLFEWLRDEGKLMMVFLPGQCDSITGRVEVVGHKSSQMRMVSDELEVAEDLFEINYNTVPVVVVGTHLLRMFDRYLEVTGRFRKVIRRYELVAQPRWACYYRRVGTTASFYRR